MRNNDKFAIDRMLPKIDIGDLIVILILVPRLCMVINIMVKLRSAEYSERNGSSE